jgi:hypothetical protein
MDGLYTDDFAHLIEDLPREYSLRLYCLWKNFFHVAAALHVFATGVADDQTIDSRLELVYAQILSNVFDESAEPATENDRKFRLGLGLGLDFYIAITMT